MKNKRIGCLILAFSALVFLALVFLAQLVFFLLKVAGAIAWSWWLVLSPVWGIYAVGCAAFCIAVIYEFIKK